jgi:hypothetical protein
VATYSQDLKYNVSFASGERHLEAKMFKHLSLFLVLVVALLFARPAAAQGPSPQHSDATWQASYWNNTSLSGNPVLQRSEAAIDYDWGTGSPATGVNADQFSVRWTRYVDVAAGTYRFTTTADDGIRVFVDGVLVINDWSDHPARTTTADRALSAGHRLIVVEYYENGGHAVARFSLAPVTAPITNWRGEYFNNMDLSGAPALVRDDTQVNFNWGAGSPAPGILNSDNFSARWTRTLNLNAGNYRFTVTADDGVRLWVNNHLLVDAWLVQAARTYTGDIYLPGGNVEVKMEYFENGGQAVAQLSWSSTGGSATPPPPATGTVIVDDTGTGFVKGGAASSWRTEAEGYGSRLTWTRNNDQVRANYNWARWYPSLNSGRYEVFVYIPARFATTTQARYWVSHRDGFTLKIVNQNAYSNQWVSLGTYTFQGTSADYVSLSDITYETYLSRQIGFDAMKWERR